jgi:glyoxylase-like metal-dependent hydrolase (beta-lactamase superfamily II)
MFECGFDTVGNATLILHDGAPLLTTDPWFAGSAYFGSWGLAHEIPEEQVEAIRDCRYVWVSHGHPDHLSGDSLGQLRDKTILVPDHRGSRVFDDLEGAARVPPLVLPARSRRLPAAPVRDGLLDAPAAGDRVGAALAPGRQFGAVPHGEERLLDGAHALLLIGPQCGRTVCCAGAPGSGNVRCASSISWKAFASSARENQ